MVIAGPEAFAYKWGQNIKKLREINGLSQFIFAARLGVSENTVRRWEAGSVEPRSKMKIRIAGLLRSDPNMIFALPSVLFEDAA